MFYYDSSSVLKVVHGFSSPFMSCIACEVEGQEHGEGQPVPEQVRSRVETPRT